MRDHTRVIRKRLDEIEAEQKRMFAENNRLLQAGRTILGYLHTLSTGKSANAEELRKIKAAAKVFRRL